VEERFVEIVKENNQSLALALDVPFAILITTE